MDARVSGPLSRPHVSRASRTGVLTPPPPGLRGQLGQGLLSRSLRPWPRCRRTPSPHQPGPSREPRAIRGGPTDTSDLLSLSAPRVRELDVPPCPEAAEPWASGQTRWPREEAAPDFEPAAPGRVFPGGDRPDLGQHPNCNGGGRVEGSPSHKAGVTGSAAQPHPTSPAAQAEQSCRPSGSPGTLGHRRAGPPTPVCHHWGN